MTTTPISAALNLAPSQPASAHKNTGVTDSADRFSDVLTRQHRAQSAAGGPPHSPGPEKNGQKPSEDIAGLNEHDSDQLALLAGAHGLGAAQLASHIAIQASIATRPGPGSIVADGAERSRGISAGRGAMAPANVLAADGTGSGAKIAASGLGAARAAAGEEAFSGPAATGRSVFANVQHNAGPTSLQGDAGAKDAGGGLAPHSHNAGKSGAALSPKSRSPELRGTTQSPEAELATAKPKVQLATAHSSNGSSSSDFAVLMKDTAPSGDAPDSSFAAATASAGASISLFNGANPVANTAAAIAAPLNSPQWAGELGRQFVAITQGAQAQGRDTPHTAELRLDPPELGPLRITINISDNVAHAVFTSAHAAVRQTLENALPQLHQLLAHAGISLGEASVNDQSQSQPDSNAFAQAGRHGDGPPADSAGPADAPAATTARRHVAPDALIDTFA